VRSPPATTSSCPPSGGVPGATEHATRFPGAYANEIWIDLWTLHFPDPGRAIEESVAAWPRRVERGLIRAIGLSNVTAEQLRAAHAVHPIAAVQPEYSMWTRDVEDELLPACRELGSG
jgi:aryl-alcohol dehydrogenase-like predicted oxidoreductase